MPDLGGDARKQQVQAPVKNEWVTTGTVAWRTAPYDVAFKIDVLPRGWRILEATSQEGAEPGWLRIEPRGFVRSRYLARTPGPDAAGAGASGCPASPVMEDDPAECSTLSAAAGGCESARAALLALREEHIRLREANVKLRETQVERRREVDALEGKRATLRQEVEALTAHRKHQSVAVHAARRKLSLCRRTIAQAVRAVDGAYGDPSNASPSNTEPSKLSDIHSVGELEVADAAVARLIETLDGQGPDTPSSEGWSPPPVHNENISREPGRGRRR